MKGGSKSDEIFFLDTPILHPGYCRFVGPFFVGTGLITLNLYCLTGLLPRVEICCPIVAIGCKLGHPILHRLMFFLFPRTPRRKMYEEMTTPTTTSDP